MHVKIVKELEKTLMQDTKEPTTTNYNIIWRQTWMKTQNMERNTQMGLHLYTWKKSDCGIRWWSIGEHAPSFKDFLGNQMKQLPLLPLNNPRGASITLKDSI